MAKVSLDLIQKLRTITGLGMLDCKKALEETDGDLDKAIEILRKRGIALAGKRADKETAQGLVHAYIHPGSQIGVLLEINCETDFVARTQDIHNFAKDVAMHIVAMKPKYIAPADVDTTFLEKEKEIARAQLESQKKPTAMIDKIVEGKMTKVYSEVCLLEQPFIKNDQKTVQEVMQELSAKTGENIKIKHFARYEIGA